MSNNLSPSTKALLQAAKGDRPSTERRAAMWSGITGGLVTHTPPHITPQAAPPPSAAPVAAGKGALFAGASMKGAFIGALFGSAISIGVATFMLRSKPAEPTPTPPPAAAAAANAQQGAAQAGAAHANEVAQPAQSNIELGATATDTRSSENSPISSQAASSQTTSRGASRSSTSKGSHAKKDPTSTSATESPDDMLMRESALVSDARRQLLTGDPAAALKSVRAARALEARQMEPEEMGLEAKALRALGRDADADKVEASLRSMYPGASMH